MNIAIDCADLDHSRIDGTRVYIKNLLNWLGKIEAQDNFFFTTRFSSIPCLLLISF